MVSRPADPPDETHIWRYMDLAKFASLAFSRKLWFPNIEFRVSPETRQRRHQPAPADLARRRRSRRANRRSLDPAQDQAERHRHLVHQERPNSAWPDREATPSNGSRCCLCRGRQSIQNRSRRLPCVVRDGGMAPKQRPGRGAGRLRGWCGWTH